MKNIMIKMTRREIEELGCQVPTILLREEYVNMTFGQALSGPDLAEYINKKINEARGEENIRVKGLLIERLAIILEYLLSINNLPEEFKEFDVISLNSK